MLADVKSKVYKLTVFRKVGNTKYQVVCLYNHDFAKVLKDIETFNKSDAQYSYRIEKE